MSATKSVTKTAPVPCVGKIMVDTPEVSVIDRNYHVFVDTTDPLAAEGFFSSKYNPTANDGKDDKLEKICPGLMQNRDPSLSEFRFLIQVPKDATYKLKKLGEVIGYDITPVQKITAGTDTRKVVFENDNIVILDYSEKSIAVFINNDPSNDYAATMEKHSALMNNVLTYRDGKRRQGYVMSKASKKYDAFMEDLTTMREAPKTDTIPDEDGVENLPTKDGKRQILIWGDADFIDDALKDLGNDFDVVDEIDFPNDRKRIVVELDD